MDVANAFAMLVFIWGAAVSFAAAIHFIFITVNVKIVQWWA